jgi:hypothetical protein
MNEYKDKIKGGKADKKKPSDFNAKALKDGTKHEKEHTSDKSIAKEIAMDHLVEDKKYYKKLKAIEKKDMIQVASDGKQEIVEGKEPLKKDPKKKKLSDKWALIKKDLNNMDAIMDLDAASQPEEQPQQDPEADQMESMEQNPPDENSQPEESDESSDDSQPQEDPEADQIPPQEMDENSQPEGEESGDGEFDQGAAEQEIIQALKDDGHSEAEIAYIVHGHHSPTYDESNEAKADATRGMAEVDIDNTRKQGEVDLQNKMKQMELEHGHASRMKDLEYQHAQMQSPDPETEKNHVKRMKDLEYENAKAQSPDGYDKEHQKRMMDVEYDNARAGSPDPEIAKQMSQMDLEERKLQLEQRKAEMKMELEFKKKEHELKLKHAEQLAAKKLKEKLAEKPAPKKKLKKSFDLQEGIEENQDE